jgi:hypothetical protein
VSEYFSWHHEEMVWAVTLQRPLQDWELGEYTDLMAFLYQLKIKRTVVDQMRWSCTTSGLFEVRSFYRLLTFHTMLQISLGEAFGSVVFLTRLLFLFGWWLKVRFLLLIICAVEGFGFWIGALCARGLVNQ